MLPWTQRPFEIANLLNPAFCSLILYESINAYYKRNNQGMPYALLFLILPIVLHPQTRNALPEKTNTLIHPWFQNHGEVRVGFARRVRRLIPYTKEAIIFGIRSRVIQIDEKGNLIPTKVKPASHPWNSETEETKCLEKAKFIGRWYAKVQDLSSLYILWGVKL